MKNEKKKHLSHETSGPLRMAHGYTAIAEKIRNIFIRKIYHQFWFVQYLFFRKYLFLLIKTDIK